LVRLRPDVGFSDLGTAVPDTRPVKRSRLERWPAKENDMPRSSRTAGALGVCSLVLACATGESSTPGDDFSTSAGSGGQAGLAGGSGAPGAAGTGSTQGGSAAGTFGASGATFGTSGETFGTAGTTFGTAGASSAGAAGAGGASTGGAASGGTSGGGTSGSGTAGTGGAKPTVCPELQGAAQPLPLTVSGNFISSGYFAGPAANTNGIVQSACEARPAGQTIGECYKFVFQASVLEGGGAYAGVFWQHGKDNWGEDAGLNVAAGATKVTFKAWSASANGGELIEFSAGGIGGNGTLCADTVNLGQGNGTQVTLTKTPTQYSIDLKGQTYPKGILGGFVWSAAVTSTEQVLSFYVDEIQWVK
jgi:hypothetical protein